MKPRPLRRTSQLTAAILAMLAHQASAQGVMTWDGGGTDANWLKPDKQASKRVAVDTESSTSSILSAVNLSLQLSGSLLADPSKGIRLQTNSNGGSRGGGSADAGGFANLGGGFSIPFESGTPGTFGDSYLTSAIAPGSSYTVGGGSDATLQFAGTSTPDSTSTPTSLLATSSAAAPSPTLGISSSTSDSLQASSLAFDGSLVAPVTSPSNSGTIGSDPPPVGQSNAATYTWANSNVAGSGAATLNWYGATTPGTWIGGSPVSDSANTIQFFEGTSTALTNTTTPSAQNSVINNGGNAFQLAILTLSGQASATPDANLSMTISGDALNFSGASGTVNLDGLNNVGRTITYNLTSNIHLGTSGSGSVLTFQGNGTNTFNVDSTISELQTGGGSLIKSGSATLNLKKPNSYTGTTSVQAGVLLLSDNLALGGTSSGTSVTSGASLQLMGVSIVVEPITINGFGTDDGGALISSLTSSFSGPLTLGSDARVNSDSGLFSLTSTTPISGSGFTLTVGGSASTAITSVIGTGAGGLTKDGIGTLTLTNANTYTGATIVSSGALNIQNDQALGGSSGQGGTTVASGAALQLQNNITTPAEPLTQGGTGQSNDGALRNISGNNTYGGLLTLSDSTRINSDSGTLTISNVGKITATTLPVSSTAPVLTFGGLGSILVNSAIGTDLVNEFDELTSSNIAKDGTGTLTLSGENTFTGTTTISGGILKLGAAGNGTNGPLGTTLGRTIISGSGAALDLNGVSLSTAEPLNLAGGGVSSSGALFNSSGTNVSFSGLITLTATTRIASNSGSIFLTNTGTITAPDTNKNLFLSGTALSSRVDCIIGTDTGGLTKDGTGTWILTGANTYTGNTTISGGTLQLGNGGETGSLSTSSLINNNGNLTVNRSNTTTQGTDFNSVIGGTGSFTQAGSGTTIMNGSNTYDGVTTISAGVLSVGTLANGGTTSSIGDSTNAAANLVFDGGALKYTGATASTNRAFTINNGKTATIEVTTGASVLTIGGASASTTGLLNKTGTGTLELTGANGYSGGTTVTAGKLLVNNGSNGSGTGSGTVSVLSGATLGGTGTIGGLTTIQSGGIHSPGNSPGIQTFTDGFTYSSGSIFNWELSSNVDNSTGTRGTHFDGVNLTTGGALTIASDPASGAIFKIVLGENFAPATAFWDSNHVWTVFSVTSPASVTAGSDFSRFWVFDGLGEYTSNYSAEGYFSFDTVSGSPTAGNLYWTAVPEPSSALAGLLVTAGLLRRRRTQVVSQ